MHAKILQAIADLHKQSAINPAKSVLILMFSERWITYFLATAYKRNDFQLIETIAAFAAAISCKEFSN